MRSKRARALGLFTAIQFGALLLIAGQPTSGYAAGMTLLRYHYVPGQTLTYRVRGSQRLHQAQAGMPAEDAVATSTYRVHYLFSQITASGSASLAMHIDRTAVKSTVGGQTTTQAQQASTTYWIQDPEGRQFTTDRRYVGAYSNGNLGLVPGKAVPVGSTWTNRIDSDVPNGPKLPCASTLQSIEVVAAHHIATISTHCAVTGPVKISDQGKRYAVQASQVLMGRWQFDVDAGRFIGQRQQEVLSMQGTVTDASGTHAYTLRESQAISMQLVSAR